MINIDKLEESYRRFLFLEGGWLLFITLSENQFSRVLMNGFSSVGHRISSSSNLMDNDLLVYGSNKLFQRLTAAAAFPF